MFAEGSLTNEQYVELVKKDFPAILSVMRVHKNLETRDDAIKYLRAPGDTGNTPRHGNPTDTAPSTSSDGVRQAHQNTGTFTASKFGTKKDIFKYISCKNLHQREIICMSRSQSTWNSYLTAWKCFEQFCAKRDVAYYLPCDVETLTDFLAFMRYEKKLESTTALSYFSALRFLHIKDYRYVSENKQEL